MDETKRLVIGTAMRAMFAKGYICVCTIDKCLEIAGLLRGGEDYKNLSALHCINFKELPPELMDKVPQMLSRVFSGMSVEDLMKACEPPGKNKSGFLTRLLN